MKASNIHLIETLELPLNDPIWYPTAVKPGQSITIKAMVKYLNIGLTSNRKAVLLIKSYDDVNEEVDVSFENIFKSKTFGAHFKYLVPTQGEIKELYSFVVPEGVTTIHFGFNRFLCSENEQVVVSDLTIFPEVETELSTKLETPDNHFIETLELPLNDPIWYPTAVKPGQSITIKAMVKYLNIGLTSNRKAVLLIKSYDDVNEEVDVSFENIFKSKTFGAHFKYLVPTQGEIKELYSFVVPEGVTTIHFGFNRFLCSENEQVVVSDLTIFPEVKVVDDLTIYPEEKIVDKISYSSISNFLDFSEQNKDTLFNLTDKTNLIEFFGIRNTDLISIINNKKVYVESYNNNAIYLKPSNFIDIRKYNKVDPISMEFVFSVSSNLEAEVLFELYAEDKLERVSFKILPLNKKITVQMSDLARWCRFGLKLGGEGVLRLENVFFNAVAQIDAVNMSDQSLLDEEYGELDDGVSIIIPSYKGEATITDTLNSIASQKGFDLKLLEIILIINGEKDRTEDIAGNFSENHPELPINIIYLEESSASLARNVGINNATKRFTVFCDDDDMLSENYISALYDIADIDKVGFCEIHDLSQNGTLSKDNVINKNLKYASESKSQDLNQITSAITMMASKIIPTKNLKSLKFNELLRSGEDVVFFTEYFIKYDPKICIANHEKSFYIRRLRDNSLSRQKISFDFNVTQRLCVIKDLIDMVIKFKEPEKVNFIYSKVYAQCGFIVDYLKKNPENYSKVHAEIVRLEISAFPYRYIQDRLGYLSPNLLVISYCHPPFVDTSSVVTAKRIYSFNELCDVICADMSRVRDISSRLVRINEHLIRNSYIVNTEPSFGNWNSINEFSKATLSITANNTYDKVYSRSFWPASHFAAFEYKRNHPEVKWIAEFSDPIILDIEGNTRKAYISSEWVEQVIENFALDYALKKEYNLYVWCELIVYMFADEIIFTCENQKKLMIDSFPHQRYINKKKDCNRIVPHPTLPKEFYESNQKKYKLNSDNVNFAYFGAFYKTRRLNDLIDALHFYEFSLDKYKKFKIPLVHIFTEQVDAAKEMVKEEGLDKYFIINQYVDYFDFLNISKAMDVLIVNDAKAKDVFGFNPYLPSKISDYLGSGSKVWNFYERNSAISVGSKENYYTELDKGEGFKVLIQILSDFRNRDLVKNIKLV